jgi:hypothetical protein
LLVEPGSHLGGASSGGLGYTDIGNKYVVTGLAKDFYRRIGQHYGKFEQWVFEPNVAEDIFRGYISRSKTEVLYQHGLSSVKKSGSKIQSIIVEPSVAGRALKSTEIIAKVFIDCTYEGDLMAKAKVGYAVGREANSEFGETYNGVQFLKGHQFPDGISPYRIEGDTLSGLVWSVSSNKLLPNGTGDKKVQAYNYRICLTDSVENMVPITRPQGYDSTKYELLVRLMKAQPNKLALNDYFIWSRMPNRKTDINNRNGFSTDMIGDNYSYPDGSYLERERYIQDLTTYTKGLLYFFGHDSRVPLVLRQQMLKWGYPKDEFTDNGNWSPQPYIREARRMRGQYIMTQANCTGQVKAPDSIGLAAYTMDSHNTQRLVVNHMVKNEGNVEIGGFHPYPISYGSLLPRQNECTNLIVPVCLSATHIAYGSIRMEPVFMVLSQVAGVAASIAIDGNIPVQQVSYKSINNRISGDPLLDGSKPELIVDNSDPSIKKEGNWKLKEGGAYGRDKLVLDGESGTVTFMAPATLSGTYQVYSYYAASKKPSEKTDIKVFDGAQVHFRPILRSEVKIVGQTSGEWVKVGQYTFKGTSEPFVQISSEGTGGEVIADAILFKRVDK